MQALVYEGPRKLELKEVPKPQLKSHEILIRVAFSGICGSELGAYLGHNTLRKPPLIMGHEFVGEIFEIGSGVAEINPTLRHGGAATVNPLWYCGDCTFCEDGKQHLCRMRQLLGAHAPGSFATFVKVDARMVHALPPGLSLEKAALTEPLACAMHAVDLAECRAGSRILLTGLGSIGLLIVQALQASGQSEISATEMDSARRSIGEQLGVDAYDPSSAELEEALRDQTNGEGFDVAIDAVGLRATRSQCLNLLAPGGTAVFVGLHDEESLLPVNSVVRKEIQLKGCFAYTPRDFRLAIKALASGQAGFESWVEKGPLSSGPSYFERLCTSPGKIAKVLLYPEE